MGFLKRSDIERAAKILGEPISPDNFFEPINLRRKTCRKCGADLIHRETISFCPIHQSEIFDYFSVMDKTQKEINKP